MQAQEGTEGVYITKMNDPIRSEWHKNPTFPSIDLRSDQVFFPSSFLSVPDQATLN